MQLETLIESTGLSLFQRIQNFTVKGITSDSRKVKENFIFVAVKGNDFDGHSFIQDAIKRGAKAVVVQDTSSSTRRITFIKVTDTRWALAKLVAQFYGQPSLKLKIVGITGTNGKTTVSYLIEAILESAGLSPAVIGTIDYHFRGKVINAGNTTPGPEQLQALLAEIQKEGIDYVIVEVSSHALDQARVEAIKFSSAIFTNLTKDHLDYHHDLNSYFAAKSKLFRNLTEKDFAIINLDDKYSQELINLTRAGIVTYGVLNNDADITACDLRFNPQGSEFALQIHPCVNKEFSLNADRLKLSTSLIGRHNIYNILAAVTYGLIQKIEPKLIIEAIKKFTGVPGRLEKVPTGSDFFVFIDYAHTEDALSNVLKSLRAIGKSRILVVFGCGGNRDRAKRPKMGEVASELADLAVITTDNPRGEEPEEIINEIVSGINKKNFRIIIDRRKAIKEVLSEAGKNDIILIAGKGHENYQIVKDRMIHFDDREVVLECLGLKRIDV
jgi:UDP-N-acetylmuramoyl-L-alanyl-D-glutamate--2,6-diaminopimelate ligase